MRNWRHLCPPGVKHLQYKVLTDCGLFLLRRTGPAGYVVQEEDQKPVKVRLGDPHQCTCKQFLKSRDLCIHICWVLLKSLRLKPSDQLSYQLGLQSRELSNCIDQRHVVKVIRKRQRQISETDVLDPVPRRPVREADCCSICLRRFDLKQYPVIFCKYSCGNPVHTRCMLQVAKHQLGVDYYGAGLLTCPLCRGVFGSGKELRASTILRLPKILPTFSHDVTCTFCSTHPVVGDLFRCATCPQVVTCSKCVDSLEFLSLHCSHPRAVKKGPNDKWNIVQPSKWQSVLPKLDQSKNERQHLCYKERIQNSKLILDLHSRCEDEELLLDHSKMPCVTATPLHPTLRRQNAIHPSQTMLPPEVRIIRMCLSKRTTEGFEKPQGKLCQQVPPSSSPVKFLKKTKKKKGQKKNAQETDSSLPLTVSSSRALGAQVHPLMAVLMSPRTMTTSLHSDYFSEDENEDEEKKSSESKPAQLTITSLQLPDCVPNLSSSNKNCLPPRRIRTDRRRNHRSSSACSSVIQTPKLL